MKAQKISKHLANDREDRALTILTTLGLGEEIISMNWRDTTGNYCIRTLTSTGVILCKDCETQLVITMFVATIEQALAFFKQSRCPSSLYSTVKKNQVRYKAIL